MSDIRVIEERCTGCSLCLEVCAYGAIRIVNEKALIRGERCTFCKACIDACKEQNAIVIAERRSNDQAPSLYSGICLYAEHRHGRLSSVVREIIGVARELKEDLDKPISAILLGSNVGDIADEIVSYGVDEVWMIDDPRIGDLAEDIQAELVAEILKEKRPEIFLGGGTIIGRSLFPRVAAKLRSGLTADCTELSIDTENRVLRQTRPAFGGNIMATILCKDHRPQMATVRHKVMRQAEKIRGYDGKIVEMNHIPVPKPLIEVLEFVHEETDTVNLADADIVVSGGRGLREPKNFHLIKDLADAVDGAVGASRAAVDLDWIPYSHQVGQTGKTVNPKVYIACGISGAIQHLAGMKSSDIIVAINTDPKAPIFDVAHYGIVGDLFEIVPEMIRQIRAE